MLPKKDFETWSVIACDQYTSEPEYWNETEAAVGETPSALRIVLPEAYLSGDDSEKIAEINKNMVDYLNGDVFELFENTMIYTKRTLKNGDVRHGIVGLIDLEDYSYNKGADTPIRATEQTVIERIPPRVAIRRDASIEIPHVMLLIDDPKREIIETITEKCDGFKKLYDFDLMLGGGHLCTSAEDALRFVLRKPYIDAVAIGMQSIEEIDANIRFLSEGKFSEEDTAKLAKKHRTLHIEEYCEGCGACVSRCGSGALSLIEVHDEDDESPTDLTADFAREAGITIEASHSKYRAIANDEKCVRCGYCTKVCPVFALKIY